MIVIIYKMYKCALNLGFDILAYLIIMNGKCIEALEIQKRSGQLINGCIGKTIDI